MLNISTVWSGIAGLAGATSFSRLPVWAIPARPGMINYIEGKALIGGQPVTSKDVGRAELDPNQTIKTGLGKAEILLTPGVFLPIGAHSELRMVSPVLTTTRFQ